MSDTSSALFDVTVHEDTPGRWVVEARAARALGRSVRVEIV
jgi:hypothetical protein